MKRIQVFIWLFSIYLFVPAQPKADQKEDPISTFASTITENDIEAHITFLADDLMEGRETGTRGQYLAAKYLASQFKLFGLAPGNPTDNSYFQVYQLQKVSVNSLNMQAGKGKYEYRRHFFAFDGNHIPQSLSGELVFGGYGLQLEDYNNLEGLDVKDKIVVLFGENPRASGEDFGDLFDDWQARVAGLQAAGAKGALMILPALSFGRLAFFTRSELMSVMDEDDKPFPFLFVSEEVGNSLLGLAKANAEELKAQLKDSPKVPNLTFKSEKFRCSGDVKKELIDAHNVLGYLEGTDLKDELVIITAHYDHLGAKDSIIYNGADDDGSGTSAVLELAQAFAKAAEAGNRPRRSILFMPVSGEEKGLLGSRYYTDHPLYPLKKAQANFNIDMIGRTDEKYASREDSMDYVYLIGADRISTYLHDISEEANKKYGKLTLDYTYNDEDDPNQFYYRSDHYNFASNEIPVIFYFTGIHEDYHMPTDDVEKIQFEKIAKVARLIFATAWETANYDMKLIRNVIEEAEP